MLPHIITICLIRILTFPGQLFPSFNAVQSEGKAVRSSALTRVVVIAIARITSEVLGEFFRVTDQTLHSLAPPSL